MKARTWHPVLHSVRVSEVSKAYHCCHRLGLTQPSNGNPVHPHVSPPIHALTSFFCSVCSPSSGIPAGSGQRSRSELTRHTQNFGSTACLGKGTVQGEARPCPTTPRASCAVIFSTPAMLFGIRPICYEDTLYDHDDGDDDKFDLVIPVQEVRHGSGLECPIIHVL